MNCELRLLDEYTQPDMSVGGPILDAFGVTYDPWGTILDKIGSLSFQIPLKSIADLRVVPGKAIQVWNTDLGEDNVFLVTERSIKPNGDAVTATVTCPEISQELQWAVVPGLVSTVQNNLTERLNAVLVNVNRDWSAFTPPKPWLQWGAQNQITDLNGLGWTIRGKNVAGVFGDLGKNYNAHWKKGPGRSIIFGRMGQDSGIVLHKWATNPSGEDAFSRAILDYELGEDAIGIVNDITGFGAGNGDTAITLESLYGRTDFIGFDPAHPVKRRLRQDTPAPGGGSGPTYKQLYDYYLEDTASIFGSPTNGTPAWRRRMAYMTAANITPAGTTQAYVDAAATALYNVMLTSLKYHCQPTNTIRVTTEHHGDVRGLAGQKLLVDIREMDAMGNPALTITQPYVILQAKPRQAGDGWMCEWTLSTTALWEETLDTQIIGNLEAIKYFTTYASVFPSETNIWALDDLDATHPVTITLRENKRAVKTAEALFTVTAKPVKSTARAALAGPHSHTVTIPALSVAIPALYVPIPALSIASISIPDHSHGDTVPNHAHSTSEGDHGHGAGVGSHSHHINSVSVFIDPKAANVVKYAAYGKNGETVVTDVQAGTYGSHTHGESAVSGATGISVGAGGGGTFGSSGYGANTITSGAGGGSYGSTTPASASTTTATASSTSATATTTGGGEHGHDIDYGIYEGPKPTGIAVRVDNQPLAPYFTQGDRTDYDATALLQGQGAHTLAITAATLGRVQVEGLIVRYVTAGLGASNF